VRGRSLDEVYFPSLVSGNPEAVISFVGQMCGRQEIELLSNIANVQINHPIELGCRCLVPIDKAGQDGPASLTYEPMVSRLWSIWWSLIGSCEAFKIGLLHIPVATSSSGRQSARKHHVVYGRPMESQEARYFRQR